MSGKPQERPTVRREREAKAGDGEPLYTQTVSISDRSGSVGMIIPSSAVKILGYEPGEQRRVEIHDDGVWIPEEPPGE
jgi:hypothetical protein